MHIQDLNKILEEYLKHFGKEEMNKYFKQLIKVKKENNNALGKKETHNSSGSN